MSGEELYNLYTEANNVMNIEVDRWEDLSDLDRDIWVAFAESLGNQ